MNHFIELVAAAIARLKNFFIKADSIAEDVKKDEGVK